MEVTDRDKAQHAAADYPFARSELLHFSTPPKRDASRPTVTASMRNEFRAPPQDAAYPKFGAFIHTNLKFDFELEVVEVALEIRQVQRAALANRMPGDLRRKRGRQHDLAGELDVQGRADIQRVSKEGLHGESVESAVVLDFPAEGHLRRNSIRHRRGHAEIGVLSQSGAPNSLLTPGLVNQIRCGVEPIGNQFGIGDEPEGCAETSRQRAADIIDLRPFGLDHKGQSYR